METWFCALLPLQLSQHSPMTELDLSNIENDSHQKPTCFVKQISKQLGKSSLLGVITFSAHQHLTIFTVVQTNPTPEIYLHTKK
ncbi:hypothetical protein T4D_17044 [Trichinella pseudospiralis]|uniref:Uncharacterized protein n=1 Tax=Trichinella pseudospiralis TaxID=6337 RepID=A0A0V1FDG2_TRIPS|nr:hypothetical protein T4D_17044 [Trichinella pseudospiralis]